jgi:hypothetical protein
MHAAALRCKSFIRLFVKKYSVTLRGGKRLKENKVG